MQNRRSTTELMAHEDPTRMLRDLDSSHRFRFRNLPPPWTFAPTKVLLVFGPGFEPGTHAISERCANQLRQPNIVDRTGIEPASPRPNPGRPSRLLPVLLAMATLRCVPSLDSLLPFALSSAQASSSPLICMDTYGIRTHDLLHAEETLYQLS